MRRPAAWWIILSPRVCGEFTNVIGEPPFEQLSIDLLRGLLQAGPTGNRWYKVNLHVHGQGNDPARVAEQARAADIDLLAITDHQTFEYYAAIAAAAQTPGRPLTVLPGIEITSPEGCHLIALFPPTFGVEDQQQFYGRLEMKVVGNTREPARKPLADIMRDVHALGGIIVIPHPKTPDIGLLDRARKMGIKTDWLDSGLIRLMQCPDDYVRYLERDANENFVNRYILASCPPGEVANSRYCLAPFNRSDAHKADEVPDGCSWFRMQTPCIEGLKQVACEPRTRILREPPPAVDHDCILALRVTGGYCDGQIFHFSQNLHCVVGQNYAGKSAVFDFLRFVLVDELQQDESARRQLLDRLNGILGAGGEVEAFVRHAGQHYVIKRRFDPCCKPFAAAPWRPRATAKASPTGGTKSTTTSCRRRASFFPSKCTSRDGLAGSATISGGSWR